MAAPVSFRERSDSFSLHCGRRPYMAKTFLGIKRLVRFVANSGHPAVSAVRSALCRFCCKSLFAPPIKNSKGYRRDIRVKMWGASSPDDKLVSDLAKAAEATKIGARRLDRLMAGKLSPRNF